MRLATVRRALALLFAAVFALPASAQTTWYVRATASAPGDGSSWATAFPTLSAALNVAQSGDEVRVAQGTYYPDEGPLAVGDDRMAAFLLKPGVGIFGGYAGSGPDPDARDLLATPSVLSGDLDQDGTPTGNAFHVMRSYTYFQEFPIPMLGPLDGFVVTGGNADGTGGSDTSLGGGVYVKNCSVVLRNLVLVGNLASHNGAALSVQYAYSAGANGASTLAMSHLYVAGNSAVFGAVDVGLGVTATANHVTITRNRSRFGALRVYYGYLALRNSVLEGNTLDGLFPSAHPDFYFVSGDADGTSSLVGLPAPTDLTGATGADARLFAAPRLPWLRTDSPGVDAADPAYDGAVTMDVTGSALVEGAGRDLGAFEGQNRPVVALCTPGAQQAYGDAGATATATLTAVASGCLKTYSYAEADVPALVRTLDPDVFPAEISSRVPRIWGFDEEGDVTATLAFDFTAFPEIALAPSARVLRRGRAGDPWTDVTNACTVNAAARTATCTGVQSFSEYTLGQGSASLPVELTAFTATVSGTSARLAWTTASETNNAGFAVEQQNGSAWTERGFVAGGGTTTERNTYSFEVSGLTAGSHAFRLRQTDTDGAVHYSAVATVEVGVDGNSRVTLLGQRAVRVETNEAQSVRVRVFDVLGRAVVQTRVDVDGTVEVALPQGLAAGAYVVRVEGERFAETRRLVVR